MTSVTFPTSLGGSGVTISDDADPNTGLLNGGHRERFVPGLKGVVDMAQYVYQYAAKIDGAAEDAERAENARGYVEAYAGALKSNLHQYYDQFATLGLSFARGKYLVDDGELSETTNASEILAVERASPKWVEGPNGYLREVAPNTIARHWQNGVCQGALIEGEATNLLTYSEDFSEWTGPALVNELPGERGFSKTSELLDDSATSNNTLENSVSVMSGKTYVDWVILKKGTASSTWITTQDSELVTGAKITWNADGSIDEVLPHLSSTQAWSEPLGGGLYLVVHQFTASADKTLSSIFFPAGYKSGGTSTGSCIVFCRQIEEGTRPTSYIPTTDTPVTRAADNISRELGAEFNPAQGTLLFDLVDIVPNESSDYGKLYELSDGTADNKIYAIRRMTGRYSFYIYAGGVQQDSYTNIDLGTDSIRGAVVWQDGGQAHTYVNGTLISSGVNISAPVGLNRMGVGGDMDIGSSQIGSQNEIELLYIPRALSAAEVKEWIS